MDLIVDDSSVAQNELISRDLPKAVAVCNQVKDQTDCVSTSLKTLLNQVKDGNFGTVQGISLLELKCHMLLNYMINLTYVVLQKTYGKKLENDSAITRLVEIRTVLEKIRPIQQKLKYHIDKVVRTVSGNMNQNDPLHFSARPDNLMSKLPDDAQESDVEGDSDGDAAVASNMKTSKAYVPPKLAAIHYDGDVPEEERQKKLLEQARKKALSSSIIRELKAEYYEGPDEVWDSTSSHKRKEMEAKHRTEYEEEYFVRLSVSKKDKHNLKMRASGLEDLTHFGDISALTHENDDDGFHAPKKKKKQLVKKSTKKRKFKKHK